MQTLISGFKKGWIGIFLLLSLMAGCSLVPPA
ncbi:MAG: hypothetical protein RLZZ591_1423, partial [Pseudomonadota bacterium]